MVERFHRTLKERLLARNSGRQWMQHLPMVLLGLRSSIREDCGRSPADLVLGTPLRLLGQLLPAPPPLSVTPSEDFTKEHFSSLRSALPMPVVFHGGSFTSPPPSALLSASHVYVRVDAVKPPLSRPYTGPYKVLEAGPKTFRLDRTGVSWTVSVDRLKRAPPPVGLSSSLAPSLPPDPDDDDHEDYQPALVDSLPRAPHGPALDPTQDGFPAPPPLDPVLRPAPLDPDPRPVPDAAPAPAPGPAGLSPVRTRSGRASRPPDRWMF